jgi:hypothetical protein
MCVARLLTCHRTPGVGLAVDDGNSVSRDEIAVFLDEQEDNRKLLWSQIKAVEEFYRKYGASITSPIHRCITSQ